ncbi:DUF2515 domain-containing protein [Paenibacillus sp. GD4]|uniref:DUF2515 domain-containing protein n=1 Tax=Paenibacillus sp. GD4 TaxID=3068890 RepID=UPI002796AD58|nr:DUF2515 domain-containing protein [Paenibacillus sp. GD4]MDQ1912104.1 DUF2515 domain-containing protein [Paenibacillus sp. GD4]
MYRWNGWDLLHKLGDMPKEAVEWLKGKKNTILLENQLLGAAHRIRIKPSALEAAKRRLGWKHGFGGNITGKESAASLSSSEKALVERIRRDTHANNRNNVTRTASYLRLYREQPELHWAFLAHMVSRNGGWCMTDLKGELLPYLLNAEQREHVFLFLERANALIFQDAYPQLLLYQASRRAGRPLFHLLPSFHVSAFMRPIWEVFWEYGDSALVTVGLVINEQHYIEERVVQHPFFREKVLDTFFFTTQSVLQLNQVVFPYGETEGQRLRVAGLVLEDFNLLKERIEVGKKLYAILFGIPVVFEGARRFAFGKRHSGSRADYWPHLYAAVRHQAPVPSGQLKERLEGGELRPGADPLYSPYLTSAWKDRELAPIERGDWFKSLDVLNYVTDIDAPFSFEMTHEHSFGLNKVELAVLAGDLLTKP